MEGKRRGVSREKSSGKPTVMSLSSQYQNARASVPWDHLVKSYTNSLSPFKSQVSRKRVAGPSNLTPKEKEEYVKRASEMVAYQSLSARTKSVEKSSYHPAKNVYEMELDKLKKDLKERETKYENMIKDLKQDENERATVNIKKQYLSKCNFIGLFQS